MWKSGVAALLAAAMISPVLAQSDEFDQGMNTMWEVLWHQSGTPTRLVRWEQDIKVRIFGVNLAQHKQHTLDALRDVAPDPFQRAPRAGIVADEGQQIGAVETAELLPQECRAERRIVGCVRCQARLRIGQAGFPGDLPGGAGHQLQQPARAGPRNGSDVEFAFLPGDRIGERRGLIFLQEVLAGQFVDGGYTGELASLFAAGS